MNIRRDIDAAFATRKPHRKHQVGAARSKDARQRLEPPGGLRHRDTGGEAMSLYWCRLCQGELGGCECGEPTRDEGYGPEPEYLAEDIDDRWVTWNAETGQVEVQGWVVCRRQQ